MLAISGLLLLTYLTIYRSFGEFGFYYDDWRFLQEASQAGGVDVAFPTRPLHQPLTEWVFNVIGYNPSVGYVMIAVLLVASVLAMYWMMYALFPRRKTLALLSTALYLLYPGDLSRTWITAGLTANRPAVLLALLSLALLFTAFRLRHRMPALYSPVVGVSVMIYFASLMLYEAQALLVPGLGFAGVLWMGMSGRGLNHRRFIRKKVSHAAVITAPYVIVFIAVLIWRFVMIESGAGDRFTETANFSPFYLARQFVGVYYFNYIEQPVEVLITAVPFFGQAGARSLILGVAGAVTVVAAVLLFGCDRTRRLPVAVSPVVIQSGRISAETRFYRNLLVVALILTGVVYSVLLPHDHIISASGLQGPFVSRLNAAGAVVVAIAGAAGLMMVWTHAAARWRATPARVNAGSAVGITAIIAVLVTFHGVVQRDYAEAWQLQQQYVQQITEALPSVPSGTHIHLEGPSARHGSSYVFTYSTEHMLRLVYNEDTITATVDTSKDGRYDFAQAGLYFDGTLIATRDRVERFRLYGIDCGKTPRPTCGHLVIDGSRFSESSKPLLAAQPPDRIQVLANLLGIESVNGQGTAIEQQPGGPIFAGPSSPQTD